MKIHELINNDEFNFNVDYRIVKYSPTPYDPDYVNVLYDSRKDKDIQFDLMYMNISAINTSKDRSIDLEVY